MSPRKATQEETGAGVLEVARWIEEAVRSKIEEAVRSKTEKAKKRRE